MHAWELELRVCQVLPVVVLMAQGLWWPGCWRALYTSFAGITEMVLRADCPKSYSIPYLHDTRKRHSHNHICWVHHIPWKGNTDSQLCQGRSIELQKPGLSIKRDLLFYILGFRHEGTWHITPRWVPKGNRNIMHVDANTDEQEQVNYQNMEKIT